MPHRWCSTPEAPFSASNTRSAFVGVLRARASVADAQLRGPHCLAGIGGKSLKQVEYRQWRQRVSCVQRRCSNLNLSRAVQSDRAEARRVTESTLDLSGRLNASDNNALDDARHNLNRRIETLYDAQSRRRFWDRVASRGKRWTVDAEPNCLATIIVCRFLTGKCRRRIPVFLKALE